MLLTLKYRSQILEIATGLEYLHSLSPMIVHGDIRGVLVLPSPFWQCLIFLTGQHSR